MFKRGSLESKFNYSKIKKQINDVYEDIAREISERPNYKKYSVKQS